MNYHKHYNLLIERARSRTLTSYTERHHVTPQCLGGTDDATNLVSLTPEEHYVAHQLLVKMHPNHAGLQYAAILMSAKRTNNKLYGWLRRKYSESRKGKPLSEETKKRMSASRSGKKRGPYKPQGKRGPRPQHVKDAVSKATKARVFTPDKHQFRSAAAKRGWVTRKTNESLL